MALETFDGAAGTLPSPPWTDIATGTAWRRNGSGAAQPTGTGANCLAAYVGAAQGDPLVLTFGSVGGGDDYIGVACFIQGTGGSADWYSVEVALNTSVISLNLFVNNAYSTTLTTWATPSSVNQAVGDKIEVTCSLVGGDPHFVIRYWDASAGTPSWVSVTTGYTDTATGSPPTGSGFGMFAYSGTAIASVLVNEWDDGNTGTTAKAGSDSFTLGESQSLDTGATAKEGADSGVLADTAALAAAHTGADDAALSEDDAAATTEGTVEDIALGESAAVAVSLTATDAGALTDTASLGTDTSKSGIDSAALGDTSALEAAAAGADAGTLAEAATLGAGTTIADVSAMSDAAAVEALLASLDAFTLGESAAVEDLGDVAIANDGGTLTEAAAVEVLLAGLDAFALAESSARSGDGIAVGYLAGTTTHAPALSATLTHRPSLSATITRRP